nr:MAG TPA: receptor binding protein [Caudoviricetes sp.]
MAWTNLDNVYVSTNGGTIAGDLNVNGTLTINDKKGTNTTYDVASQITSLRDSVSRDAKWIKLNNIISYRKCGNMVTVIGASSGDFGFGNKDEYSIAGTLPSKYRPSMEVPFVFHAMGGTSYNKSAKIETNGQIKLYDRGAYVNYWGFCVTYPI